MKSQENVVNTPIRGDTWAAGGLWLAYTLFYGFMPVWLAALALVGFNFDRQLNWRDFLIHGEFLIYSASLVAASTRLMAKDIDSGRPFPHRPWFNLVSHAVIIPSAAMYAIAKAFSFLEKPTGPRETFILYFSAIMMLSAVLFSFWVFILDHDRSIAPSVNLPKERKREEDDLSKQFDLVQQKDSAAVQAEPEKGNDA